MHIAFIAARQLRRRSISHPAPGRTRMRTATGLVAVVAAAVSFAGSASGGTLKSQVWAGYQADQQTFQRVTATWTVPTVTCSGLDPARGDAESYLWAALGSGSVSERVGVREFCTGTLPAYATYLEMNDLYEIQGITPAPGDTVSASVSYAAGKYRFALMDSTQHKSFSLRYPCGAFGAGACSRSTAEVGAGIWFSHQAPLADYGSVAFRQIGITAAAERHGSFAESRHWKSTRVVEYDGTNLTATASPLVLRGTGFTDTWRHP
jgi:hypothetical protein